MIEIQKHVQYVLHRQTCHIATRNVFSIHRQNVNDSYLNVAYSFVNLYPCTVMYTKYCSVYICTMYIHCNEQIFAVNYSMKNANL